MTIVTVGFLARVFMDQICLIFKANKLTERSKYEVMNVAFVIKKLKNSGNLMLTSHKIFMK